MSSYNSGRFIDPSILNAPLTLQRSHATYSMAVVRHENARKYKRQRKAWITRLVQTIARLERDNKSTTSLTIPDTPPLLSASPSFPVRRKPSLVKRVAVHLKISWLKRKLKEAKSAAGGFDMDNFQNPELASPRPLDMNRPWRM